MKKNTKKTASTAAKGSSPRPSRSKVSGKPVTIDLTPEKSATRPETGPATGSSSAVKKTEAVSRSSVPKSRATTPSTSAAAPQAAAKPSAEASAESADKKFGRDAGSSVGRDQRTASAAEPSASTRTPASPGSRPANPTTGPTPKNNSKSASGWGGRLVAGLVGGLIALGGAYGLQYAGVLSSPANIAGNAVSTADFETSRNQLNQQIADLQNKLADISNTVSNVAENSSSGTLDTAAVNSAVDAAIDERLNTLTATSEAGQEKLASTVAALQGKLDASANRLETLQSQLLVTDKTVDALKSAIATGSAGDGAGLATLNSRQDELVNQVETLSTRVETLAAAPAAEAPADNSAFEETIAQLEQKLNDLTATLDQQSGQLDAKLDDRLTAQAATLETINGRTGELTDTVSTLSASLQSLQDTATSLSDRVESSRTEIAGVMQQLDGSRQSQQQAVGAIAAAALKSDIDKGEPFAASLEMLRSASVGDDALSSLDPYAQKGIPTVQQITRQFATVGDQIIAALAPPPGDDLKSRLLAGARSFVKVRPIAPAEGDSPAAQVAMISTALESGKLEEADALWNALPEAGQQVSKEWRSGLSARITANEVVARSVQSYLRAVQTQ